MTEVFLNGPPKMGNHALWKACELLGIASGGVNHVPFGEPIAGSAHLFVKRDPRNALVSWVRFNGMPVTQGTLITAMAEYLPQLQPFEPWLADPAAFVVRFERLIADNTQMREIAAHCGVPYLDDAWPNLPNHTRTWTGRLSNWAEHWTLAVSDAWADHGGPELQMRWGY